MVVGTPSLRFANPKTSAARTDGGQRRTAPFAHASLPGRRRPEPSARSVARAAAAVVVQPKISTAAATRPSSSKMWFLSAPQPVADSSPPASSCPQRRRARCGSARRVVSGGLLAVSESVPRRGLRIAAALRRLPNDAFRRVLLMRAADAGLPEGLAGQPKEWTGLRCMPSYGVV